MERSRRCWRSRSILLSARIGGTSARTRPGDAPISPRMMQPKIPSTCHRHRETAGRPRLSRISGEVGRKVQGRRRAISWLSQPRAGAGRRVPVSLDGSHLRSDGAVQRRNPNHYRLFNIQTVIAPVHGRPRASAVRDSRGADGRSDLRRAGRRLLRSGRRAGRGNDVAQRFLDVNDRWMASDWVALRRHLLLDWSGRGLPAAPASRPRISPDYRFLCFRP